MATVVNPAIDPASYSNKDLLLLTQLLHTQGLIVPEAVIAYEKLGDIGREWYNHKSSELSRRLHGLALEKAPSGQQVAKLYQKLLETNGKCKNTTDLANFYYYSRIQELEKKILEDKEKFNEILGE